MYLAPSGAITQLEKIYQVWNTDGAARGDGVKMQAKADTSVLAPNFTSQGTPV